MEVEITKKKRREWGSARISLIYNNPIMAPLMKLQLVEDLSVETAETDGKDLTYNPYWLATLNKENVKVLFAHEILHVLLLHPFRLKRVTSLYGIEIGQLAADIIVDMLLDEMGFTIMQDHQSLLIPKYKGWEYERVAADLAKGNEKPEIPQTQIETYTEEKDPNDKGNSNQQNTQQSGKKQKLETKKIPITNIGGIKTPTKEDSSPMPEKEVKDLENEWKMTLAAAIKQHQKQKGMGTLPGEMDRLINELFQPVFPWEMYLAQFLTKSKNDQFSWQRPDKRFIQQGFYLPSLFNQITPKIAFIIDTSGSVSKEELTRALSEAQGALMVYEESEMVILFVDTQINGEPLQITSRDSVSDLALPKGGGGTSFVPGFEWLKEHEDELAGIVYVTDGYCDRYPDEYPDEPVLWLQTENYNGRYVPFEPPFGQVVKMETE